jgi:streptomycin 6-kinase
VPCYLAQTAARDPAVGEWLGCLPQIVTGLGSHWLLRVGAPFQPGGQCSWTAHATDAAGTPLVLKVAFRSPGEEERDQVTGLRAWDGNGTVRLHVACHSESGYGLLMEPCLPGTALRQRLPEPEQDVVVAGLLHRLWARPHPVHPFRPLAQMCAAWAEEFEATYAAAPVADRIDAGLARAGIALFRELPGTAARQALLRTDLHADNILAASTAARMPSSAPWPMPTNSLSG